MAVGATLLAAVVAPIATDSDRPTLVNRSLEALTAFNSRPANRTTHPLDLQGRWVVYRSIDATTLGLPCEQLPRRLRRPADDRQPASHGRRLSAARLRWRDNVLRGAAARAINQRIVGREMVVMPITCRPGACGCAAWFSAGAGNCTPTTCPRPRPTAPRQPDPLPNFVWQALKPEQRAPGVVADSEPGSWSAATSRGLHALAAFGARLTTYVMTEQEC